MQHEERSYKVYLHTFPNYKVYVGITTMSRTYERWKGGHGYRDQPLMWNAIQKYGWENIRHAVLFDGLTKDEAEALEIQMIRKYRANDRKYGYNIDNGGKSRGRVSAETRKRMSESHKGEKNFFHGKHLTDDHKKKISETLRKRGVEPANKRPLLCVETGVIYESTAQATRETGIHNYAIRRVCYGERKTAGGFHWRYV